MEFRLLGLRIAIDRGPLRAERAENLARLEHYAYQRRWLTSSGLTDYSVRRAGRKLTYIEDTLQNGDERKAWIEGAA